MQNKIIEISKKAGIQDVGFCSFEYIKDNLLDCRAKARLPENSKTVILFLFPYRVRDEKPVFISRYSAVPDYHLVCTKYLNKIKDELKNTFKENIFEAFIDNSPIPEVSAAVFAGLGMRGKNGLLINEKYGSYVFIGEIVTDLEIRSKKQEKDCSLCGDCFRACPIGLRKGFCLSAVSQQKNDLSFEQKKLLFDNKILWGCDICAEVCPHNKKTEKTYIKEFIDGYKNSYEIGDDISSRAFNWRGEKVIKRNYLNLLYDKKL